MRGWLAIASVVLGSCGGLKEGQCLDRGDCDALQVCVEELCVAVECIATPDCAIGQYCDTARNTCEVGCDAPDGCLAGEDCVEHECIAYECRSTVLDCALGEMCGEAGCEAAPGCHPCSPNDSLVCRGGQCVDFDLDAPGGDHCLLPCTAVDDPEACPRGLECRDLSGEGHLFCYADCPVYLAELGG